MSKRARKQKNKKKILWLILGVFLLVACGKTLELQVSAEGKTIASFQVEIARTSEEHQKGLQKRTFLGDNEGMLFVFPEAVERSFWMKETLMPLDIIFVDQAGQILNIHGEVQPCELDPCPHYFSEGPAQYVLEIKAGRSALFGIKKGDLLTW